MNGMNRRTGRWLSDLEHLKQSIQVILTTRVGTRIERREFGSLIPNIIDYPIQDKNILLLYAAVATALAKYEPRLKLQQLSVSLPTTDKPRVVVTLEGIYVEEKKANNVNLMVEL